MTTGIYRSSCSEGCLDRLRLTRGTATHVARQHLEETGHPCIVTPLDGDERTLVDERPSSDADRTAAGRDDREEVEPAGRSSKEIAPQR